MEHTNEFLAVVNDAKARVAECDVAEARDRVAAGAVHLGRGIIERDIVGLYPEKDTELVLYCGGGFRSALAADMLQKMGYTNVVSMDGGWKAWKDAGAPTEA